MTGAASIANDETATTGRSCASASPFTKLTPMRTPAKLPGPTPQTYASSCAKAMPASARSEEHTSELQSLMRISYAVFCLKKKKPKNIHHHHKTTQENTQHN